MLSQPVPFTWNQVDETLAGLMISDLAIEFGTLNREDEREIHYQNIGNRPPLLMGSSRCMSVIRPR